MELSAIKRRLPGGAFLWTAFAALIPPLALYLPGLGGGFYLDDIPNLGPLSQPDLSWQQYILNGFSGPLGRPLSYLSFYLQHASYPAHPAHFKAVNLAIHLLNTALVYWLTSNLCKARGIAVTWKTALSCTILWGILPVHISTVLYVVQRMTLLSAFFVLLSCAAYVHIRLKRIPWGKMDYILATGWVGVGYLGVFAKENAILTGLALASLEAFFLSTLPWRPARLWRWICFYFPFLMLVIHLTVLRDITAGYASRDFTLSERLLTQSRVIFDYLKIILAPDLNDLTLYHDNFPVSRSVGLQELWSLTGLATCLTLIIKGRHRWWFPLSFALTWFFSLHLLESTIIPLEIYFEHRNYLPSVGLIVGLFFLAKEAIRRAQKRVRPSIPHTALGIMMAWMATITAVESKTWGNPLQFVSAAWYKNPDSLRTMQELSSFYLAHNKIGVAYQLQSRWKQAHPEKYTPGIDLRILMLSCLDPKIPFQWDENMRHAFLTGKLDMSVDVLQEILDRKIAGQCEHLRWQDYQDILDSFANNPNYRKNGRVFLFLKKFKTISSYVTGDLEQALTTVISDINLETVDFDYLLLAASIAYEANAKAEFRKVATIIRARYPYEWIKLGKHQRDLVQKIHSARL